MGKILENGVSGMQRGIVASLDLLVNEDRCNGYSCLTMIDEETVGILYESRGGLIFQRFLMRELLNGL